MYGNGKLKDDVQSLRCVFCTLKADAAGESLAGKSRRSCYTQRLSPFFGVYFLRPAPFRTYCGKVYFYVRNSRIYR